MKILIDLISKEGNHLYLYNSKCVLVQITWWLVGSRIEYAKWSIFRDIRGNTGIREERRRNRGTDMKEGKLGYFRYLYGFTDLWLRNTGLVPWDFEGGGQTDFLKSFNNTCWRLIYGTHYRYRVTWERWDIFQHNWWDYFPINMNKK